MGAGDGAIFARRSADVGGVTVSYLEGGTARDVEPVLYLHGLGGGGKWESFHMAMGTVTQTIAPNLPGFAEGVAPEGFGSVRDYASLVAGFLETLDTGRVALVGHSFGGWLAQYLAVEQPERFSRLVLIDPLGLDVPEAPAADLSALDEEAFATAVFAKLGLIATAQAYGFGGEWQNIREGPEFERQWRGRGLVAALAGGRPVDAELTRRVRDLRLPTLLLWGALDGIAPPAQGESLHASIAGSQLEIVERAGHLPMIEKPETMNRLIRDFLVGAEEAIEGVTRA